MTCSFKTWDWNKLLRAEHFLPVVCHVWQQGKMCSPSSLSIKRGSAVLFFALKHQCGELFRAGTVYCSACEPCLLPGHGPTALPHSASCKNGSKHLNVSCRPCWHCCLPQRTALPLLHSPLPLWRWPCQLSLPLPRLLHTTCRERIFLGPAHRDAGMSKEGNSANGSYSRGKEKACDMGKAALGYPQLQATLVWTGQGDTRVWCLLPMQPWQTVIAHLLCTWQSFSLSDKALPHFLLLIPHMHIYRGPSGLLLMQYCRWVSPTKNIIRRDFYQ